MRRTIRRGDLQEGWNREKRSKGRMHELTTAAEASERTP
ncbi:hypothetical protein AKJ09_10262 [Labilithrix luteola]|uniref:Uncharacterized protein n=1 Tax=Labilithrix luteola TaxID=1391654 RepID=A0A0K1QCX2_9BACT|nr:hypothetical protein AKJ09_10262 [Labilithrix luteola]